MATNNITTPPSRPGVILLRGDLKKWPLEGVVEAAKTVVPGMLVEKTVTGAPRGGAYQPHATAGGFAEKIVAMPPKIADEMYQTFAGGTVDDSIAAGQHLSMHICQSGDELHMFLKASGAAVVLTDFLESAGNGDLQKSTSTNQRLFKPLEAVTPGSSRTRIRVRAL